MGAVTGFLSNYSGNIKAALALWPAFSLLLTLPILAYLYHRDGRLRLSSVAIVYLAVLYLLGIGCFTLWPLPDGTSGPGITYGVEPNFNLLGFVGNIQEDGLRAIFELLFNVVFFTPLGFIAGRMLRLKLLPTLLLSFAVSLLVETAQLTGLFGTYPYAYRCFDVDDLVTNTLGGVIGWLAAAALGKALPDAPRAVEVERHPGFVRRCVALWIDLMLVVVGTTALWSVVIGAQLFAAALSLPEALRIIDPDATSELAARALLLAAPALFLVLEAVVPWFNGGRTPGGSFTHMTCESHSRTTGWRLVFYAARVLTLAALIVALPLALPVLAIFYAVARRMPYDYVP